MIVKIIPRMYLYLLLTGCTRYWHAAMHASSEASRGMGTRSCFSLMLKSPEIYFFSHKISPSNDLRKWLLSTMIKTSDNMPSSGLSLKVMLKCFLTSSLCLSQALRSSFGHLGKILLRLIGLQVTNRTYPFVFGFVINIYLIFLGRYPYILLWLYLFVFFFLVIKNVFVCFALFCFCFIVIFVVVVSRLLSLSLGVHCTGRSFWIGPGDAALVPLRLDFVSHLFFNVLSLFFIYFLFSLFVSIFPSLIFLLVLSLVCFFFFNPH